MGLCVCVCETEKEQAGKGDMMMAQGKAGSRFYFYPGL